MDRFKGMMGLVVLAMAGAAMPHASAAGRLDPGSANPAGTTQEMSDHDQWACTVAMCMAAPGGPQSVSECNPPMERLRRHLAKGKPFPVCRFLGGGGGNDRGQRDDTGGSRRGGGSRDNEHDPLQAL
ncbi:hypothetical protein [Lysobacter fragariae]